MRVLTTLPPKALRRGMQTNGILRWPVLRDRSGYVRGYLQYMSFDIPLLLRLLFGARDDVYVVEPPPTTGVVTRLVSAVLRRPYVYYAADVWSDAAAQTGAADVVVRVVRALETFAMRGAAVDLSVSDGVCERVRKMAPNATVEVVGHGVDTALFTPEGKHRTDHVDIVYVGTMSEWHGAEIAVQALIRLLRNRSDLSAAFIGQGSQKAALRAAVEAASLQDRIRFLDPVPAAEAAEWLRSARIALATLRPGAGYDFAVPTKLYAALACGTPVAYCGPDPVHSVVEDNLLGRAARYDAAEYALMIEEALEFDAEDARVRVREWVETHVSAGAVARRSALAIESVAAAAVRRDTELSSR